MFLVIISLFSIRCLVFGVPDLIPGKGQTLQQGLCGFLIRYLLVLYTISLALNEIRPLTRVESLLCNKIF